MKPLCKKILLPLLLFCFVLSCGAAAVFLSPSALAAEAYNQYLPDAAPTFSRPGGVYFEDDIVFASWGNSRLGTLTLQSAAEGADIYYTTDGSLPTAETGTRYSDGIDLANGAHTITAVAYKDGKYSDVTSETYYIGSENYIRGATASCGESFTGSIANSWGGLGLNMENLISVIAGDTMRSDTAAAFLADSGYQYLQVDLGQPRTINYLQLSSIWGANACLYCGKIEIGDGADSWTTVWEVQQRDGTDYLNLTESSIAANGGYIAENAPYYTDHYVSFALFLPQAATGQYIRYSNASAEGDLQRLDLNYILAANFSQIPESAPQYTTKTIPIPEEVNKVYDAKVSEEQILEDLAAEYPDMQIGDDTVALEWAAEDFTENTNGTFYFYGVPETIPEGYSDLYRVAVKATVVIHEVKDQTYGADVSVNNYLADAAPVFSRPGGVYFEDDIVFDRWGSSRLGTLTLQTAAEGADIYYTTDGSVPTKDTAALYEDGITLGTGTHVVSAVAYKDGKYSDVTSETYYIGSENYIKGATASCGEGFSGSIANSWAGGNIALQDLLSYIAGGTMRSDTAAAFTADSNYQYLQIDLGQPQTINYLQLSSIWGATPGLYCSKIEIGDGADSWTTVWEVKQRDGAESFNLTESSIAANGGYIAENAPYFTDHYVSFALFLQQPVTGRYIRYTNKTEEGELKNLHLNYILAAQFDQIPPADQAGQYIPVAADSAFTKSYEEATSRLDVLTDLSAEHPSMNILGNVYGVEWFAPEDFDGVYGGTFVFIGLPQGLPAELENLYNVALTAEVSLPVRTNPTELRDYLEELQIGQQSEYTASTWAAYAASLAKAQGILEALQTDDNAKTQTEVDDALNELKADVEALVRLGNKTDLNAKIAEVEETDLQAYTDASAAAFRAALEAAREAAASDDVSQADVDNALGTLEQAFAGLVLKADKTELNRRIGEIGGTDLRNKTPETAEAFTEALNNAKAVAEKADASQQETDEALAALNSAYNALADRADKSALSAKIAEAETEAGKTIYTSGSLAALKTALAAAKEISGDDNATQQEADAALSDLTIALSSLVKLGDRTALKAAVETLETEKDKYTESSWTAFAADALLELRQIAEDPDASESDVAAAEALLAAEKAKLVLRADTTALQEKLSVQLQQEEYTGVSWLVYLSARNNAMNVIGNADATQADADAALEALNQAIGALKKLGDKTALNALLAEAKGKLEGKYEEATLSVLEKAIKDAETIAADAQASEEDVSAAESGLRSAIDGLKSLGGCSSSIAGGVAGLSAALLAAAICAALLRRKNVK